MNLATNNTRKEQPFGIHSINSPEWNFDYAADEIRHHIKAYQEGRRERQTLLTLLKEQVVKMETSMRWITTGVKKQTYTQMNVEAAIITYMRENGARCTLTKMSRNTGIPVTKLFDTMRNMEIHGFRYTIYPKKDYVSYEDKILEKMKMLLAENARRSIASMAEELNIPASTIMCKMPDIEKDYDFIALWRN